MVLSMLKIRPARVEDLDNLLFSFKGYTAEIDGKVEGVCGILYSTPIQAISWSSDKLKRHPRAIVKIMRKIQTIIKVTHAPVYAIADPNESTASGLLIHAGFVRVGDNVFKWGG